jgi:hypothetical protein
MPGTEHSRLLQKFVKYDRKKFYNIDTGSVWMKGDIGEGTSFAGPDTRLGRCYKTFYVRNLLMVVVRWSVCPWQASPA